jgi:hypothetical protein
MVPQGSQITYKKIQAMMVCPLPCTIWFPINIVLLVNVDCFEPNNMLVNANKLKPYCPYDNDTKGLVFEFKGRTKEGMINLMKI